MAHIYTIEKIYNFTCSRCKNWWSYATSEYRLPLYMEQNMYCPHCGHRDSVAEDSKARMKATEQWVKQGRRDYTGYSDGWRNE